MARDPPALLGSSELRDLSLQPSSVRSARITIVHPQLRDLVLPLERGRVLYPRGTTIEEQRWSPPSDEEETDEEGVHKGGITGSSRPLVKLGFTPNCLTASRDILACGGQHGELYISNLPQPLTYNPVRARTLGKPASEPIRPFTMSLTLPTRSINNSLVILPSWPEEWQKREEERTLGFIGRGDRTWDEEEHDGGGRVEGGEWVRTPWFEKDLEEEDEEMDLDEEEDDEVASPASVATYPNTVPFLHAPRIPNLPSSPASSIEVHTTRRASSFSHDRPMPPLVQRAARQSFSIQSRPGQPPIQYVTSLPRGAGASSRSPSISSTFRPVVRPDSRMSGTTASSRGSRSKRVDEPRLLVSNNDQTVKMFSLRPLSPPHRSSSERRGSGSLTDRVEPSVASSSSGLSAVDRAVLREQQRLERDRLRTTSTARTSLPAPPPRFGSRFGWDNIAMNDGVGGTDPELVLRDIERMEERYRRGEQGVRREVLAFERALGMRRDPAAGDRGLAGTGSAAGAGAGAGARAGSGSAGRSSPPAQAEEKDKEERKLAKIGGTRFKYAINHSSLSPDLKTMVSVGDSTDVYLFEVIEGGREFRKIGMYSAATDSGFSTSWSKDGRKFAVASQDGQVTVWDHRSSRPLAIFHSSSSSRSGTPSFSSDPSSSRQPRASSSTAFPPRSTATVWDVSEEGYPLLIDPVTGDPRLGGSSSGREAARVVKFSPEGSSRDLMVFSEENSNIHIIDARTFHTHVILPVPADQAASTSAIPAGGQSGRSGVEGGTWGIAGVAFDPSGDWLYSGTERTVVEWDMRRCGGGGEAGTWQMA